MIKEILKDFGCAMSVISGILLLMCVGILIVMSLMDFCHHCVCRHSDCKHEGSNTVIGDTDNVETEVNGEEGIETSTEGDRLYPESNTRNDDTDGGSDTYRERKEVISGHLFDETQYRSRGNGETTSISCSSFPNKATVC